MSVLGQTYLRNPFEHSDSYVQELKQICERFLIKSREQKWGKLHNKQIVFYRQVLDLIKINERRNKNGN